ncbi:MAG: AraC family transcriptional regulator [Spirochaetaceae bacterium]
MTIYEQIQKIIDYLEDNLSSQLTCEEVADEANMSVRSLYNYFWAISGFSYKQYVIKRRLTKSLDSLQNQNLLIVDVAFESGYETHESFSRAFKNEFGVSPVDFRKKPQIFKGVKKLEIINEMHMGVVVKSLKEMKVVAFEGFAPEPEEKAKEKMVEWLNKRDLHNKPHRIFGFNIDLDGKAFNEPENEGYKFLVTISDELDLTKDNIKTEVINAGNFVVTGIEGNFEVDPTGKWITEGWQKLKNMIKHKGYKIKHPGRWFEEELEPSKQGNLRLDLYLEIE